MNKNDLRQIIQIMFDPASHNSATMRIATQMARPINGQCKEHILLRAIRTGILPLGAQNKSK